MINEVFWWQNGTLSLSKTHIKNMKRNMRKVPIIQIKSDLYHKKEDIDAEKIISKIEDTPGNLKVDNSLVKNTWNEGTRIEKILWIIKDLF